MTLQDVMANDLKTVFLNVEEFAVTGTFTPKGGAPFVTTSMPGDIADLATIQDGTAIDQQRCLFLFSLSALKAGILAQFPMGAGLPTRGDAYIVAQQGSVGLWRVESHAEDLGDGCCCWMRFEAKLSSGGQGATVYR